MIFFFNCISLFFFFSIMPLVESLFSLLGQRKRKREREREREKERVA
jgi:hypothetical protein